jgi:ABC-type sugar transport system ATPase subunit
VLVLRDGGVVGCGPIGEMTRRQLIEMMVGRALETEFPRRSVAPGEERLRVEGLTRGEAVQNVSFQVRRGEVLGLAGLSGAGRTETARLLFGADRADGGRITIDGREVDIRSPRDAMANRICLLTEDRKAQGLILKHSVQDNFGLPNLARFRRGPFVDRGLERAEFDAYAARLKIKAADPEQPAASLSGGNQQKVVLAKWLAAQANIVLFDEPTRGIDVAAKLEIYHLINALAAEGKAIVMISSEIAELLGMCDRILVMHAGKVRGEITDVASAKQADILSKSID